MKTFYNALFALAATVAVSCNNNSANTTNTDSTAADTATQQAAMSAPLNNDPLTGHKWILTELMGKTVADTINGKEPYIMFIASDSTYNANGGCNGLGGKFTWDAQTMRIRFKQGISTMMACPDMSVEDGFKNVFDMADNYSVTDTSLTLNKARMAPLARFKRSAN